MDFTSGFKMLTTFGKQASPADTAAAAVAVAQREASAAASRFSSPFKGMFKDKEPAPDTAAAGGNSLFSAPFKMFQRKDAAAAEERSTATDSTGTAAAVPSYSPFGFLTALRKDAGAAPVDSAAEVAHHEVSVVYDPSRVELEALTQELHEKVAGSDAGKLGEFHLQVALHARKGDVARAQALLNNYAAWRARVGPAHPAACPSMAQQAKTGLIVSPGARDMEGRAVMYLRPRYLDHRTYTPADTVKLIAYVYEWSLRTYPWARTHGFSLIIDADGLTLMGMDTRAMIELRSVVSQTLPVRVAAATLLSPPAFLALVFNAVSVMMSRKIKARIRHARTEAEWQEVFDSDAMPEAAGVGGTLPWTDAMHAEWVERLLLDGKTWYGPSDAAPAAAAPTPRDSTTPSLP